MQKETIWITGAAGKLGSTLVSMLMENYNYKVIDTDKDVDVTDMEAVSQHADLYRPTVIINCASISDVIYCERNMVEAFRVNALGARNLAAAARKVNARMIQMSTDDVFSGNADDVVTEFDVPDPVSVYGKSKYAGENYVKELSPKHVIVRSSWIYGVGEDDFYNYVLKNATEGKAVDAPMDRFSAPTSADELAKFICTLVESKEYGVFHASCEGVCSRFEFAREILELNGLNHRLAMAVNANEEGRKTATHLDNLMMKMTKIYEMPYWKDALKAYVSKTKRED